LLLIILCIQILNCQEGKKEELMLLFNGVVMDASTLVPLSNSEIFINRSFCSLSEEDGTFAFWVKRNDTVLFSRLGYKSTVLYVSDTLSGREFNAGIYMQSDTLSIGEVIIVPRLANLRSEILNAKPEQNAEINNARYNVAVSAYQGLQSQSSLGDPALNYEILRQKQRIEAYERGGIPSNKMVGISPLILLPAAYLLIHGLPEKPAPLKPSLTRQEVDQIHQKYLESLRKKTH
jgi:hypothetical protein